MLIVIINQFNKDCIQSMGECRFRLIKEDKRIIYLKPNLKEKL